MRLSLRLRLTVVYGALFLLAGVVLVAVTYLLFDQELVRIFDEKYGDPGGDRHRFISIVKDGVMLGPEESRRLLAEQEADLRAAATTSLLAQGVVAVGVVACLATALGWVVAGRVLAPLHQVTATARRIAAAPDRGLRERIDLDGPVDEVKELADTFDTMVARLDRSFDGQRRFVANASHELRTPLTLNRALVELAMHRRAASPDVRQLGESLLEINARHERLISGLLLLARAEHEVTDRSPVDLADIVAHVVAQTAQEAEQEGIAVYEETFPAPTTGNALLLERLATNLVENGIRHNLRDGTGWVRIATRTVTGGQVTVTVTNTGPTVPPYDVPELFEPFRRLDGERVLTGRSAGLGLSIVRSVARAHGGDVTARPREGGGLVMTATLPRADG
ncbi:HAMP domain-containing sensor histidine kinase [Nonomuraea sp. MCN248]|uniref:histidine kinase n=1 Tax=Nonomuraea corallina TaxID=2989783 RepID=A0ABT4SNY4_9ACTN|nr:HAMP domain-containing sensor histidine kinase [Nonomuraea corallina]MDA0638934.1 HAMP domain-containing sensor histidine kinase [Nonomuraea corallina]